MYYLLIEAAGVRQAMRIHREWHDRFNEEIGALLGEHGFLRVAHEGDLFLFGEQGSVPLDPEEVADAARVVLAMLQNQGDNLLDYVVILDYHEPERADVALARIERLLRFVRVQNAAYVTASVASAVESVVELGESGKIFLVQRFLTNDQLADRSFERFMIDTMRTADAEDVMKRSENRDIWITTSEISRTVTGLRLNSSVPTFVLRCSIERTAEALLSDVVRQLDGHLHYPSEDDSTAGHMSRTVHSLVDRFSRPGEAHLATLWSSGELELTVRFAFARLTEEGRQPIVILEAFEMAEVADRERIIQILTDEDRDTRLCRLIAVATTPMNSCREPINTDSNADTDTSASRWEEIDFLHDGDRQDTETHDAAERYWRGLGREGENDSVGTDDIRFSVVLQRTLSRKHQHTLYIIHDLYPVLELRVLDELYPRVGISLAERARILKDFVHIGVINDAGDPRLHRLIVPVLSEIVSEDAVVELRKIEQEFLREKLVRREVPLSPAIWELLRDNVSGLERNRFHHDVLQQIAAGGSFDNYGRFAGSEAMNSPMMQLSDAAGRLKLYLRDSRGPHECVELYNTVMRLLPVVVGAPAVHADAHLGLAEFFLARREYAEALRAVKDAIMLQQNAPEDVALGRGVAMSHLLMARIMFAQRRLADAGQYLGFAREEAERDVGTSMIARGMDAIRLFLEGNLSRSERLAEELHGPLLNHGYTDWFVLLWFLLGRINYELGDYDNAAEQFAFIRQFCMACSVDAPQDTVHAWEMRCRFATEGTPEEAEAVFATLPETPETLLFRAEVFSRYARFAEALPLLEAACEAEEQTDRWPRLGVCWDNGFASIEDLIIANRIGSTELLRIVRSYYAWTLAHLDRQEEAVPIFYALTRGNDGAGIDPYTGLYNYLYSSVLPEERSGDRDDRLTILGKSVKLIQERTSHIDEYRDKIRYLRQNAWNQQLMQEARQHNLV